MFLHPGFGKTNAPPEQQRRRGGGRWGRGSPTRPHCKAPSRTRGCVRSGPAVGQQLAGTGPRQCEQHVGLCGTEPSAELHAGEKRRPGRGPCWRHPASPRPGHQRAALCSPGLPTGAEPAQPHTPPLPPTLRHGTGRGSTAPTDPLRRLRTPPSSTTLPASPPRTKDGPAQRLARLQCFPRRRCDAPHRAVGHDAPRPPRCPARSPPTHSAVPPSSRCTTAPPPLCRRGGPGRSSARGGGAFVTLLLLSPAGAAPTAAPRSGHGGGGGGDRVAEGRREPRQRCRIPLGRGAARQPWDGPGCPGLGRPRRFLPLPGDWAAEACGRSPRAVGSQRRTKPVRGARHGRVPSSAAPSRAGGSRGARPRTWEPGVGGLGGGVCTAPSTARPMLRAALFVRGTRSCPLPSRPHPSPPRGMTPSERGPAGRSAAPVLDARENSGKKIETGGGGGKGGGKKKTTKPGGAARLRIGGVPRGDRGAQTSPTAPRHRLRPSPPSSPAPTAALPAAPLPPSLPSHQARRAPLRGRRRSGRKKIK